jgi:hypothetical protein
MTDFSTAKAAVREHSGFFLHKKKAPLSGLKNLSKTNNKLNRASRLCLTSNRRVNILKCRGPHGCIALAFNNAKLLNLSHIPKNLTKPSGNSYSGESAEVT